MEMESRSIENIIRYWIRLEEIKRKREDLVKDAKDAAARHRFDSYLRVPDDSPQYKSGT